MSLFRRKTSPYWYVKISAGGRRVQESTGTADRRKAQEFHDRLKASLWEQAKLGQKPRRSWQQAVVRYITALEGKASVADARLQLRWLDDHLGKLMLDEVTREVVEEIRSARMACQVKPATVNRTLEVLRAVLKRAEKMGWIDRAPAVEMLEEPTRRVRWLTREEAVRLLKELPEHLRAMAEFSLETGLREANVTGLEWGQVDLRRRCAWVHADQAKAGKPIAVPLSERAVEIVRGQLGRHLSHVFTYAGRDGHVHPVERANNHAWRKALRRAGIKEFRWHDLRHTWASWHIQAGTPMHVLQELGGWSSYEMVRRYAHLSAGHLAEYVERLQFGCTKKQTEDKTAVSA